MNKGKITSYIRKLIDEIGEISTTLDTIKETGNFSNMNDRNFNFEKYIIWDTKCHNLLEHIMGGNTIHHKRFIEEDNKGLNKPRIMGRGYHSHSIELFYKRAILNALLDDIESDAFFDEILLISADNYQEILQQADILLSKKYKDSAAVLIGAIIEVTLRKLCNKNGIVFQPKDTINSLNNLLKDNAYNALIHKQIIAWADLRNNAAHGHFDKYILEDVKMMYDWTVRFLEEHLH